MPAIVAQPQKTLGMRIFGDDTQISTGAEAPTAVGKTENMSGFESRDRNGAAPLPLVIEGRQAAGFQ